MSPPDRVIKDISDFIKYCDDNPDCEDAYIIHEDDMSVFDVLVKLPLDSAYRHGFLHLEFKFDENYPKTNPVVTAVYSTSKRIHPSIHVNGKIPRFAKDGSSWDTNMNVISIVESIRSLFDNDPYKHETSDESNSDYTRWVQEYTYTCLLLKYTGFNTSYKSRYGPFTAHVEGYVERNFETIKTDMMRLDREKRELTNLPFSITPDEDVIVNAYKYLFRLSIDYDNEACDICTEPLMSLRIRVCRRCFYVCHDHDLVLRCPICRLSYTTDPSESDADDTSITGVTQDPSTLSSLLYSISRLVTANVDMVLRTEDDPNADETGILDGESDRNVVPVTDPNASAIVTSPRESDVDNPTASGDGRLEPVEAARLFSGLLQRIREHPRYAPSNIEGEINPDDDTTPERGSSQNNAIQSTSTTSQVTRGPNLLTSTTPRTVTPSRPPTVRFVKNPITGANIYVNSALHRRLVNSNITDEEGTPTEYFVNLNRRLMGRGITDRLVRRMFFDVIIARDDLRKKSPLAYDEFASVVGDEEVDAIEEQIRNM
ncbi:hypothetical protein HDU85_005900 [Gaertneriomyces sp. JEL0708]|nr:hypothetical protein HDU85_005900 [Gaertneriomyces sp. JEL0708]